MVQLDLNLAPPHQVRAAHDATQMPTQRHARGIRPPLTLRRASLDNTNTGASASTGTGSITCTCTRSRFHTGIGTGTGTGTGTGARIRSFPFSVSSPPLTRAQHVVGEVHEVE